MYSNNPAKHQVSHQLTNLISVPVTCKLCILLSLSVTYDSLWHHGLQSDRFPCPCSFPGKTTGLGSHFLAPGNLPNPGIEPALQAGSLQSKLPEIPPNARVGRLSLLQQFFLTQKLSQCLLHCRESLYQLNYQGSPMTHESNPAS